MCKGTKKKPCLAALTNDPKFQMNLKDCVQRIFIGLRQTKRKAASIPTDLKDPIGKISNLMEKAVPYAGTELVQFSFCFSSGQKYRVVSECSGFGNRLQRTPDCLRKGGTNNHYRFNRERFLASVQ